MRQSGGNVVALRRSVTRWRATTGFAGALAAALAVVAVLRGPAEERIVPLAPQVALNVAPSQPPAVSPPLRSAAAATPASGVAVTARSERGAGNVALATGESGTRGGVALEPRSSSWSATLAPVADRAGLTAELDSDGVLTVRRLAAEAPAGKAIALWLLTPDRAPRAIGVLTADLARFPLPVGVSDGAELAVSLEPNDAGAPAQPSAPYAYRGKIVRQ